MSLQTKRRLWFFFAFCVVFLIFLFSSQNGEQSKETSGFFVALFPFIEDQEQLTFVIRKLAHFSIFACLAFCLFQAVDTYDISLPKRSYIPFFSAFFMQYLTNGINRSLQSARRRLWILALIPWVHSHR